MGESWDLKLRGFLTASSVTVSSSSQREGVMEKALRWSLIASSQVLTSGSPLSPPTVPLTLSQGLWSNPESSLGYPGPTSRAQAKREGGRQEGTGLCSYLNHRKGTALPQHTAAALPGTGSQLSTEQAAGTGGGEGGSGTWAVSWTAVHCPSRPLSGGQSGD